MLNFTESSDWYRAIDLKERVSLLDKSLLQTNLDNSSKLELGQKRLKKWRDLSPLKKDTIFAEWLKLQNITEQDLLYLLGQSNDEIKQCYKNTPEWLQTVFRAFTYQTEGKIELPVKLPKLIQDESIVFFLDTIKPLIDECSKPLNTTIQELSDKYKKLYKQLPFDPQTIKDILLTNLLPDLLMELIQIMVKKCAELRQQGLLKGDNPKQRYEYFLAYMRQKDIALDLLQEYPVLARRLVIMLNNWVKFSSEMLERLCKDWSNIKNLFILEKDPGVIILDKGNNVGDSHSSGQVITLTFSSGFRLLYKPRSLSMDLHFQELLNWLNNNGLEVPFRKLKILDCSHYGWMEFVSFQTCSSENEVSRFYYRQGGYLALLYVLYGTDFHSENLIASGEHPILVDLETLFSPPSENNSDKTAAKYLQDSVLRTGLLPIPIFGNKDNKGIDFSGLAGLSGQLTPYLLPYLELSGTDEIHIVQKQLRYEEETTHRPKLNGKDVILQDYIQTIVKGFTDVYQVLQKNVVTLLSPEGLINRFAKDEIRIILRPTREYGILLTESSNPNMLRNSIACEWLFDNLWKQTKDNPLLLKVIASERESLLQGFIPRFFTYPESTNLWSDDNKCVANFFTQPVIELVKTRLQQLNEENLRKQIWIIQASFITLIEDTEDVKPKSYKFISNNGKTIDNKAVIKTASAIGDQLVNLAITDKNKASWLGLQVGNLSNYYISSSKLDLYDGLAGTTLFLAYLGYVTNQSVYTDLAKKALENIKQQIKQAKNRGLKNVGGFGGLGGIIYLLTHLAKLWNDPSLLSQALEMVQLLPPLIEKDDRFDLIYGSAGCIISLARLRQLITDPEHLQQINNILIQCGNHLVSKAEIAQQGKAWVTIPEKKPPLGMSHGVAGIAWSLLELSGFTKDSSFASTAKEALSYERSFFSPQMNNWPDINRDDSNNTNEKFRITWCHGATGIGIARLLSIKHLSNDKLIEQELSTAIKTVIKGGFGNNHSLCHGDLGNLDFLLQVMEDQPERKIHSQVQSIASIIFNNINNQGWLCGTPFSLESPGLMVGIAGIGYQLLRLVLADRVPSVLCLAPPKI